MRIQKGEALLLATLALVLPMRTSMATDLTIFAGGSNQRPDILRSVLDSFEREHPDIHVKIETGGATSELQRQYLSTVLSAQDDKIDILALDIINPAQYAKAGWLEPLDSYLGADRAKTLAQYLPSNASANLVDGKLVALPFTADSLFLYYRKDLLTKYHLAVPRTWDELAQVAKTVQQGESKPQLQGLSFQGAPIEGTVCTFLLPYWSQGKTVQLTNHRLQFDQPAAIRGLNSWLQLIQQGVAKKNSAEVKTGDTVDEFKAGQVLFALNWGFAWDKFQHDTDSQVRDQIGVAQLPALNGGKQVSCTGGWQWGVSAFSKHKADAVTLIRYLSQPSVGKIYATRGSILPVYPALYSDSDVIHAVPWFADARAVVESAQARPSHARYGEISDLIRTQTSAALAGTQTPEQTVSAIAAGLKRIAR